METQAAYNFANPLSKYNISFEYRGVTMCAPSLLYWIFILRERSSPLLAIAFKSAEMLVVTAFPLFFCHCLGDAFGNAKDVGL